MYRTVKKSFFSLFYLDVKLFRMVEEEQRKKMMMEKLF